jgi:hypothetical protein
LVLSLANLTLSSGEYWTSGTSAGVLSADVPIWCGSNQFIDTMQLDIFWTSKSYSEKMNRYMTLFIGNGYGQIKDDIATGLHDVFCEIDEIDHI